jgi:hypothetical protein
LRDIHYDEQERGSRPLLLAEGVAQSFGDRGEGGVTPAGFRRPLRVLSPPRRSDGGEVVLVKLSEVVGRCQQPPFRADRHPAYWSGRESLLRR